MDTWTQIGKRHGPFRKLQILCEQQNHKCCYCGIAMIYPIVDGHHHTNASIEHINPISRGGKHGWNNLVAACAGCNMMRSSDIEALEFYEWRITQLGVPLRLVRKNIGRYRKAKLRAATAQRLLPGIPTLSSRGLLGLLVETLKRQKFVRHVVHMKMGDTLQLRVKCLLWRQGLTRLRFGRGRSLTENITNAH